MISLRAKLALIILTTVFIVSGFVSCLIYLSIEKQLNGENLRRGKNLLNALNYASEHIRHSFEIVPIVQAFGAEPGIELILVAADDPPRIIAATRDKWIGQSIEVLPLSIKNTVERARTDFDQQYHTDESGNTLLQLGQPLLIAREKSQGKLIKGAIVVQMNRRYIREALFATAWQLFGWTSVLSIILASLIYLLLHSTIVAPVNQIVKTIINRTKNNTDELIENDSKDEIGLVATALNEMFAALDENQLKLVAEKARAEEYLEITKAIIVGLDHKGNVMLINQFGCDILGYQQEELIGENWFDKILPERDKMILQPVFSKIAQDIAATNQLEYFENDVLTKSGEKLCIGWHNSFKRDNEGHVIGSLSAGQDITRRNHMEKKIIESEKRLLAAQEIAHIGSWDWNILSGELAWTDEIYRIFGLQPQQFSATYAAFLGTVHPDDREKVVNAVNSSIADADIPYRLDHRIVHPDGTIRVVEEIGEVYRDQLGKPIRMIGSVHDVTNQIIAAQKSRETQDELENRVKSRTADLEKSKLEAENANNAKSEFLSRMSHELRTPLNAILGFTQLLGLDKLNAAQSEYISEIIKGGNHLLNLINDILDLSRIEAGRLELTLETVDVSEIISHCYSLMRPLAEERQMTIQEQTKDNCFVIADATRLKQVLINLLANAIKYNCAKGSIVISCAEKFDTEQKRIRISITDTGCGISPTDINKIFVAFERLGTRVTEGTGIGLSLTNRLVNLMGGNLGVNSKLNVGSTFWIDLRYSATQTNERSIKHHKPGRSMSTNNIAEKLYTVLYVEDNPANLRLVKLLLDKCSDIKLFEAHTAQLGLDIATGHRPDLILLDINLPEMNGFELLKKLKQNHLLAHIPIIAISANAMKTDIESGLNAGFNAYITKPINIEKFYSLLHKHLPHSKTLKKQA